MIKPGQLWIHEYHNSLTMLIFSIVPCIMTFMDNKEYSYVMCYAINANGKISAITEKDLLSNYRLIEKQPCQ